MCFKCKRPGHWAKDCSDAPCRKCRMPLSLHTQLGAIECAWRGQPCGTCGQPPHPDGAEGRCARYAAEDDTDPDRSLRAITAWRRDADPDSLYRLRAAS